MCQVKPLGRCSTHAPKQLEAAKRKYNNSLELVKESERKLQQLQQRGATSTRLKNEREKLKQRKIAANHRVADIWEASLYNDATHVGFPTLEKNSSRWYNASILRKWHNKMRKTKDSNGLSIFSKSADPLYKQQVLEQEYTIFSKNYQRNAYKLHALSQEMSNLREEYKTLSMPNVRMKQIQERAKELNVIQDKTHSIMIVERAQVKALEKFMSDDFKNSTIVDDYNAPVTTV